MSRFLNLPQRSEVPDELLEQFFGTKSNAAKMEAAAAQSRNEQEKEEKEQKQSALPPASSSSASTSPNQRQKISFQPSSASFVPSAASSGGGVLSKGTGPLGPLLGFGQLGLGLGLLCLDALTNPLSQSWFAVSASLCAILCALLSFISARFFYHSPSCKLIHSIHFTIIIVAGPIGLPFGFCCHSAHLRPSFGPVSVPNVPISW
jgi:hypothetical protein